MAHRNQAHPFGWLAVSAATALVISASACSGELNIPPGMDGSGAAATSAGAGGSAGKGGGANGGSGSTMASGGMSAMAGSASVGGGTGGTAGTAGTATTACVGPEVTVPKRLIRLSFNQIANSITSLFDEAATEAATASVQIPSVLSRTFPPLGSGVEGNVITDTQWSTGDTIAQGVGKYVFDNFATLTSCGATPTTECGRGYVSDLADRAFRRPLSDGERTRLLGVFDAVLGDGGSVQEAVQYGVYAVFESPLFLYRTEFGADANAAGTLSSYELANQIAFFLTEAPPDAELLAAARDGLLSTPEQVGAAAARLLATTTARTNFEAAISSYFSLPSVGGVVIDAATIPGFSLTAGARSSIYHEAELFLQDTLWNGPLAGLITSRRAYVNSLIAPIYGLSAAGRNPDTFETVDLDDSRAGLLTLAAFLIAKSRPDNASVVGRGLVLNGTMLCQENPEFPEGDMTVAAAIEATSSLSQKEQADYRARTPTCRGCHVGFDGFGLALERFDSIGRSRTMDLEGRPIDDAWITATLPDAAGAVDVRGAGEMAQAVVASGAMQACMAKNLIEFALGDTSQGGAPIDSCAVRAVIDRFQAGDQSFTSLLREIATSSTLSQRTAPAGGL
jgi:hypothetical protein